MERKPGCLYLLPMPLGQEWEGHIPEYAMNIMKRLSLFLSENARTARRFMTQFRDVHTADYPVFNKRSQDAELQQYINRLLSGEDIGYVSEAGLPCIADPGARLVRKAHENGIRVIPAAGSSAIIMSLIASGLNGQKFRFNGYLPQRESERKRALQSLEQSARKERQTEIFMETPYRNEKMIESTLEILQPETYFCIAANVTQSDSYIYTARIKDWKRHKRPDLHKVPAVFCIGGAY